MLFKVPDYKFKEKVWFLTETDQLLHGEITMITLALREDATTIYYSIQTEDLINHTATEGNVINTAAHLPKPKFQVGDLVEYTAVLTDGKQAKTTGVVETVELTMFDPANGEVVYYMSDDPDYWVLESDVIGFGEVKDVV